MTPRTWPERLLAVAGLAVFALVAVWRELAHFPGDVASRRWVFEHPVLPSGVDDLSGLLANAGTPAGALVVALIGGWALRRRWGAREAFGLLLATAAVVVAEVCQRALGQGAQQLVPTAYPSGHVVWATAVFGYLALRGRRHGVPELTVPALALVLLMGPERVVTGAHGISDVLGGYGLGVAWAVGTDRWVSRRSRAR